MIEGVGIWIKLRAPEIVDIAADAGFDFLIVDLEHAAMGVETAATHIALACARGVTPLVRVASPRSPLIGPLLDAGAAGVVVAHVDTPEDAAAALGATRFPPNGHRGSGSTGRVGRWGQGPRDEYLAPIDGPPLCIAQIESTAALESLPAILDTGIDAVLVGPADLRLSMHEDGSQSISDVIDEILRAAQRAFVPCGTSVASTSSAVRALDQGFAFVAAAADTSLLASAAHDLVTGVRERGAVP